MSNRQSSPHSELLQHAKNMDNVVNSLKSLQLNDEPTHEGLHVGVNFASKLFAAAEKQDGRARAGFTRQGLMHLENVATAIGTLHPNSRHHQSALMVVSAAKEAAAKFLLQ